MAKQTINAPASWLIVASNNITYSASSGPRPLIIPALRGSAPRYFLRLRLIQDGRVTLQINAGSGG